MIFWVDFWIKLDRHQINWPWYRLDWKNHKQEKDNES